MGPEAMMFQLGWGVVWACRCTIILEAIGYDPDDTISKSNDST